MTPRFVPFESMSDAEQREHLRDCHGDPDTLASAQWHADDHSRDGWSPPHTHDKPAPRPEENR